MHDELTTNHIDVRIALIHWLCLPGLPRAVKRVRRAVKSDESFAVLDGIKKRLLAFLRHGLTAIFGRFREQITLRVKQKRVELRDVLRRENAAILRAHKFPVMLFADRLQNSFRVTRLTIFHMYY